MYVRPCTCTTEQEERCGAAMVPATKVQYNTTAVLLHDNLLQRLCHNG